jgi:subtilisin-like proprotein convertase family protein
MVVERAEASVTLNHPHRGEMAFALVSPAGTTLRIEARQRDVRKDYKKWTFSFVGFWGESAAGRWTLLATDTKPMSRSTGELVEWKLTIRGHVRY